MAKLIRSCIDCGNRQQLNVKFTIGYVCLLTGEWCAPIAEQNFPPSCPLEEGIPLEQQTKNP